MSNRLVATCVAVATVAALTGCGGSGDAGGTSGDSKPSGGATIDIVNFKYSPTPFQAKVGQEITVTNKDAALHTITANDKSFDSKNLKKDETFVLKIDKAGKYTYLCDIHQYMTGVIEVS